MGDYRSRAARQGPRLRRYHWSERSWANPRRWLAAPMIVASLGTVAAFVGAWAQMLNAGLSAWGGLTVVGVLVTVGAIAWTQSDINHRNAMKERNRNGH